jgi:transcriptional regulator with XRE-family HTH domain
MYYDFKESGKRIKQIRKAEGLTQEQMAERLCLSLEHYGKFESGKRACSIDVLVSIATEFDVSLDYLILGKERCSPVAKKALGTLITGLQELEQTL